MLAEALGVLNTIGNIASVAFPIINTIFGHKDTNQSTTGGGSMTGGSSSATTQAGMTQQMGSQSMQQTDQSMQMGDISALGNLLKSALTTQTGSNWKEAFQSSMQSAQTANNMQLAQWTLGNALNQYNIYKANQQNLANIASARQYNSNEAALERSWAKEMRQTAYQDTVKDLQASGLNPILAASRGATGLGTGAAASASTGGGAVQAAQAMSIPSAHAASAQAMYDYGNNTMQFLNNAMATINTAKQYGYEQLAKNVTSDMMTVSQASSRSISEYAQKTDQWANTDISQFMGYNFPGMGEEGHKMGGGQSHGGGGGRGR